MARRSTPENIAAAHRAGTRARLTGEGVSPERADAWVDAWEAQEPRAAAGQDAAYWTTGWDWIAAQGSCGGIRSGPLGLPLRGRAASSLGA
jgi:hypothetical protein